MKPDIDHKEYLRILRKMTPEQRLLKSLELSELTRDLFKQGLRKRFPNLPEEKIREIYLERMEKCHNRNY